MLVVFDKRHLHTLPHKSCFAPAFIINIQEDKYSLRALQML